LLVDADGEPLLTEGVARNWEEHYAQAADLEFVPAPLLVEVAEMLPPGRALDLACGAGRNAVYLASLGWRVVAVDSSPAAIQILKNRSDASAAIEAHVADLETGSFVIEPEAYDLICDFFYLQRDLFAQIREGVRPGGVVAAEIHLRDEQAHRFVLDAGELRGEFSGWKILYYSEGRRSDQARPSARIIARRA
jgi:SAM-dependent methyltransferase